MRRLLYAALLALVSVQPAFSQSLKHRRAMNDAETALKAHVQSVAELCGIQLPVAYDWQTFTAADFESNNSLSGWCQAPADAMRSLCGESDGLGKKAVQEKVKSYACVRGPKRDMTLKDGKLTYTVSFDSVNDYDFAYQWFLNNL